MLGRRFHQLQGQHLFNTRLWCEDTRQRALLRVSEARHKVPHGRPALSEVLGRLESKGASKPAPAGEDLCGNSAAGNQVLA